MKPLLSAEHVGQHIYLIRGHKVMLDSDLAKLYGVPTKTLNLAVKRNAVRFPSDFMFRLTRTEVQNLKFQFETSSWGGRRYFPYAFTEQGVAMLSSVLKSERAALVNIAIMRAFVRLREIVSTHKGLTKKLEDLERWIKMHDGQIQIHGKQIRAVFEAIKRLMETPTEKPRLKIGFKP